MFFFIVGPILLLFPPSHVSAYFIVCWAFQMLICRYWILLSCFVQCEVFVRFCFLGRPCGEWICTPDDITAAVGSIRTLSSAHFISFALACFPELLRGRLWMDILGVSQSSECIQLRELPSGAPSFPGFPLGSVLSSIIELQVSSHSCQPEAFVWGPVLPSFRTALRCKSVSTQPAPLVSLLSGLKCPSPSACFAYSQETSNS